MHTRTYTDHLSGLNVCIICAGCCSMQCNCAEGLHFSAFHFVLVFMLRLAIFTMYICYIPLYFAVLFSCVNMYDQYFVYLHLVPFI